MLADANLIDRFEIAAIHHEISTRHDTNAIPETQPSKPDRRSLRGSEPLRCFELSFVLIFIPTFYPTPFFDPTPTGEPCPAPRSFC